jgi:hypothetical protein
MEIMIQHGTYGLSETIKFSTIKIQVPRAAKLFITPSVWFYKMFKVF